MSNNDASSVSPLLSRHELLTAEMARLRQSTNQSINQSALTLVHNLSQLDANLQASITHIYTQHIEQVKLSNSNEADTDRLRSVVHTINQQQSRDFIQSAVKVAQQLHQSVDQSFKQAIEQSKLLSTIPSVDQLIDQCEWWTSESPLTLPVSSTQTSARHINQSIQHSNRSPVSSHHPAINQSTHQSNNFPTTQQLSVQQPSSQPTVDNKPSAWPLQPQNGSSHNASLSTSQRFNQPGNGTANQSTSQPLIKPAQPISQPVNHSVGQPASTSTQSLSFGSFGPPPSQSSKNDQHIAQPSQPTQPTHQPLSSHGTRSSPPVLHPTRAATKPAARDAFVKPPPSKYREDTPNHTNQSNQRGRAADNPWTRSKPQNDRRGRDYDDEDVPQRGSRKRAAHSDSDEEADNHFRSRRPQRAADRDVDDAPARRESPFMSGRDKLVIDAAKKGQKVDLQRPAAAPAPKSRRFNPPRPVGSNLDGQVNPMVASALKGPGGADDPYAEFEPAIAERLRAFDPKLVESIRREEMETSRVTWDDVAGLEFAKAAVKEAVILPMKRPDLFTGIREPPKGMLLFGPPGTGKTLIGQAMASEAGAKFYSISASSLTSKWHGEGEKLVRTLFGVAACFPPAIIFIDEIDSLLTARTDGEFEASRRMKTELLVQMEGATSKSDDRVLVLGATNRPQDLDDAAKRRLVKRLYIPLPNNAARLQLMRRALGTVQHTITDADFEMVAQRTRGYSGADLKSLCREAAMEPLRCMSQAYDSTDTPRAVTVDDMFKAITQVKASVATKDLESLEEWDRAYGMQVKHVDD